MPEEPAPDAISNRNHPHHCGVRALILDLASALIPADERDRYRNEWIGECNMVANEWGWWSAFWFCTRLLASAPRTAFVIRTSNRPVFFDALLVALTLAVPALFFVAHSIITWQVPIIFGYGGLAAGLLVMAAGLWQAEEGLFASSMAKAGLILALVSSAGLTAYQRSEPVVNPALDGPFRVFPGTALAMCGLAIFLASGWLKDRRLLAIELGATVTGIGLVVWALLLAANIIMVDTWTERLYHAVALPSVVIVACVCWLVRKRGSAVVIPAAREPIMNG